MVTPQDFVHRRKIQSYILDEYVTSVKCESLAKEVSLEWSHYRISTADAKGGTPNPPPESANVSDIMIT